MYVYRLTGDPMNDRWTSTLLRLSRRQARARNLRRAGGISLALLLAISTGVAATQWPHKLDAAPSPFWLVNAHDVVGLQALVLQHPELVKAIDPNGNTLLHLAAVTGQKDLVHFLLAHGASPNALNHEGYTPLVYGLWSPRNQIAIVDALLAAGADPQKNTAVDDQQELIDED
jgi:ankyrin repeat protein